MYKTTNHDLLDWIKTLAIAAFFFFSIRLFIFSPLIVDGASMMPTYENGDKIIVNKIGKHISEFDRFDIIVFNATEEAKYIKRIIGLPGDYIYYQNDVLYVNGHAYAEPFLEASKNELTTGEKLTPNLTLESTTGYKQVPAGYLFVLGDNRPKSKDSRHIGLIPIEQVIGEANIRFYPLDAIGFVK